MNTSLKVILILVSTLFFFSCQVKQETTQGNEVKRPSASYTQCKKVRAQICTREFIPVCARRDKVIRCVKAPCPNTEYVTKPNACVACSDKSVVGYTGGACTPVLTQLDFKN